VQTDLNNSLDVLGRLLTLHAQSLPMYLADARPWARASEEDAVQALELVVADQRRTIERIKNQIMDAGGVISHGAFPMQFTGLHDVAL